MSYALPLPYKTAGRDFLFPKRSRKISAFSGFGNGGYKLDYFFFAISIFTFLPLILLFFIADIMSLTYSAGTSTNV